MRSLLDILDFSVEELYDLMNTACDIIDHPDKYKDKCVGKKIATLFFEPSTRTRLSFEAAMLELGGSVIGFTGADSSSSKKGESVADTVRIMGLYADIIAMRHFKEGAATVASQNAQIPVINAGDGGHWHPTQTLADLLTIYRRRGSFDNLTIGLCGDLKYGRTVHSLINALSRYENITLILISPNELKLPDYMENKLKQCKMNYKITENLEENIKDLDILYMTRIQRERFSDEKVYERLKDTYILDNNKMMNAKADMAVLHPLPRVNEIRVEVDDDPRAAYFEQALNGKYMRMALILKLLSEARDGSTSMSKFRDGVNNIKFIDAKCGNKHCITEIEQELPNAFVEKEGKLFCAYCEQELM